ncbi:MAG: PASTA domain-containing protein [Oscillospiraceae bacterium]|nr:PASTA domain-containing protein [Oscillospiraceae bacterium]
MAQTDSTPNRSMIRRALFLSAVCGILAFTVLIAQLFRLQILRHDELEGAALRQQLRRTAITAGRGTIYDVNGRVLAISATTFTVYLSPAEIAMNGEDPELIASGLSGILGKDRERILGMAGDRRSWYKTVARQIDRDRAAEVRAFKARYDLQGVKLEPDTKRYYPYSNLAAHLIGFVGVDNTGLAGVEYTYNDELTGTDGSILRLKNSIGTDLLLSSYEDYVDAENGNSVYLTIDADLQYFLEKQLRQAVRDYDVQNGAAGILMDPRTGAILAMASLGDFDLNRYQEVSEDVRAEIGAMTDEDEAAQRLAAAQQAQWRNKAISDTYEPGSTFKIITLAMALEEGLVNPGSSFFCGGSMSVQGRGKPLNCWKHAGHGPQTLTQAVQHSCNVAFASIGLRVGEETFYRYCEDFGFFRASEDPDASLTGRTGIPLPGESGSIWWSRNVFCNPENFSQLAAASFGQTFNITPLQMITAVSACCNGGYLMQPYVVDRITDADGALLSRTEPQVLRQVISEATSRQVNAILEQVVCDTTQGTGKNAYVAGYRVAGKTGTSEKVARDAAGGSKEYIVSFIGYAPADDPRVICLVLMDTPSASTGIYISGGQMAAPVVGKIMADVLPCLGVEPRYTAAESRYLDRPVPEVTGMTLTGAKKTLKDAGLNVRIVGEGDTVTDQLPGAGTAVAAGSAVILYAGTAPGEDTVTMPELTGLTYAQARDRMGERALFVCSDGTILADSDTVRVAFQSIPAGTALGRGDTAVVTLVNDDNESYGIY